MKMRNWLDLGRKKVDTFDLDATVQWIQQHFGYLTLSYWGMGVQNTTQYPNPFPITLDNGQLTGSVGNGVAFDPHGQLVRISAGTSSPRTFNLIQASVTYDRWDLLVLRYKQGRDTLVQKPSNPLVQVPLNLHDDFELFVRPGAPAGTPTYPPKVAGDIILAGLRLPAGAQSALGNVVVDLSVRELAQAAASLRAEVVNEIADGAVDGANRVFSLSKPPLSSSGVAVFLDSLKLDPGDYTIEAQTITLGEAPVITQVVSAYYVANSASTANPLATQTEQAVGTADGSNRVFNLSGLPADKPSTLVFVNGIKAEAEEWSLVQGVDHGQIQFTAEATPAPGQSVSVLYFVNPATVGRAGSVQTTTPGGSGNSSTQQKVEYPVLTDTDVQNGYVTLLSMPANPTQVVLDVIGDGPKVYGVDFVVSGQQVQFQGEYDDTDGMYPLSAGDQLRILYWT